jgi:RNA polymerase sigma-70 factor (ECF subfamily)
LYKNEVDRLRGNTVDMTKAIETQTDEQIVLRMQAGELTLYEELVKRYQGKLVHYATTIVYDHDIAMDVTQDGLIKAYKKINSFDSNKKFSSWIFRIIHNQAIDYLRKHKNEMAVQDNEWLINTLPTQEDRELELEKKIEKRKVWECLNKLPMDYRTVLTLYYMEDRSYLEISDILRIPPGTVATRISRGKKALVTICGEELE